MKSLSMTSTSLWPDPEQALSGEGFEHVLYWEHILEYEQTKLRPIFEEEIKKSVPGWCEVRTNPFGKLVSVWRSVGAMGRLLILGSGFGWRGLWQARKSISGWRR